MQRREELGRKPAGADQEEDGCFPLPVLNADSATETASSEYWASDIRAHGMRSCYLMPSHCGSVIAYKQEASSPCAHFLHSVKPGLALCKSCRLVKRTESMG